MTDTSAEVAARKVFRAGVLEHVDDLGRMCRWVVDHRDFPLPEPDMFVPRTWSASVWSDEEFERLAAVMMEGCPVERENDGQRRLVRRRFGTVWLEVWVSRPMYEDVANGDAALAEDEELEAVAAGVAEDDLLERERGLRDDD